MTEADREIQERVRRYQRGGAGPKISHLLAPDMDRRAALQPSIKLEVT